MVHEVAVGACTTLFVLLAIAMVGCEKFSPLEELVYP